MRSFISLFFTLIVLMNSALAQTSPGRRVDGTVFTGQANIETNYVLAPQPYKESDLNSTNTATSSATLTRDTTAGNLFQGLPVYVCNTSSNGGYCEFKLSTILKPHDAGNCAAYAYIKGDATLYGLQITDGTTAVVSYTIGENISDFRLVELPGVCGSTRTVRVTQTVAGTSPDLIIGWVGYSGYKPGAGVPPNTFTAKVSATGVVTDEAPSDWISGNFVVSDTSLLSGTPTVFTQNPNCSATYSGGDAGGGVTVGFGTMTSSTLAVRTGLTTTSANFTKTAFAFNIRCTKTGSDYIQPAITPNQWNFETRNSTPTWGNLGFTPGINKISYTRKGDRLFVEGLVIFASGTGSGSTLSLTIPEGLSIDTTKLGTNSGLQTFGSWSWYDDVGSSGTLDDNWGPVNYAGPTTVTFRIPNTSNPFVTSVMAANDSLSFNFNVPIVGWTENQGAPQLVGSVTSNSASAIRFESARMSTGGSSACSASPCAVTEETTAGVFGVTRTSAGRYVLSIAAGVCSTRPKCWGDNNISANNKCTIGTTSTTAGFINCNATSTNTAVDEMYDLNCTCNR